MKKINLKHIVLIIALITIIVAIGVIRKDKKVIKSMPNKIVNIKNEVNEKSLEVDKVVVNNDKDGDGILDLDDIVAGARMDAKNKTAYTNKYYLGGYPPDNEGVCTDVVWRALKNAGYNFKDMIDKDISENLKLYPRVEGKPDRNIDFRRVPNLLEFFSKNADSLTLELKANDAENLKQWQGGDIVTFDNPQHVVIISDKRRKDGVPYIIHNGGPYTKEQDRLQHWMPKITGHFRFPKSATISN